ncbi:MAG: acriflavine resistance protein B [Verrucomicrobiales bacterium]|nr:acriflavine resistance protein B [Verrucomicrobiales bacterium]
MNQGSNNSMLSRLIQFCLENRLVVILVAGLIVFEGLRVAPFDWNLGPVQRNPVPTDAIPDIGENQQIVFTEWMGRSPQDVEDQIGYPLTVSLLGIPGVKSVRSYSMFGFSSIYVIFKEDVEFYWSRSRVLEKLNSLPAGTLPDRVQPTLGPDATALGQVFWYTLEGHDENGKITGGWDLDELRSIQDWYVRYSLQSADGVSEVASAGGFVREYQIDVNPDAMRAFGVSLGQIVEATKHANMDVGARSIEVNRVEYFIRGLGFVKGVEDLEETVVAVNENVPVRIRDIARVILGPALRRGALDKGGAEAVGGVVVARFGENPLAAINAVKEKIDEIADGLPEKAVIDWHNVSRAEVEAFADGRGFDAFAEIDEIHESAHVHSLNQSAWLDFLRTTGPNERPEWLKFSKIRIVPFYDRSGLIRETLGTLNTAIIQEILVTIIVVLVMVRHLASSALISGLLPLAVLMTFIAMRQFGVDANIVALSGIAIAIGTMVDMGIVICENILRRLEGAKDAADSSLTTIHRAASEVAPAVLTAVATTVISFLPVFAMEGAEGKLFKPLAFTKTFALAASIIVALTLIPPLAHMLFTRGSARTKSRRILFGAMAIVGGVLLAWFPWWVGSVLIVVGVYRLIETFLPERVAGALQSVVTWLLVAAVALLLAMDWLPLGPERGLSQNVLLVTGVIGGLLFLIQVFLKAYSPILRWALENKRLFLTGPLALMIAGASIWLGFDRLFGWMPSGVKKSAPAVWAAHQFPGLGKEFMPNLDEGSYLFMPTTMPHASIGEALDVLQKQDMAMQAIPEIESVVGKLGRAESPLDPAPVSMFETIINYRPKFLIDANGRRLRFRFEAHEDDLARDEKGKPLSAPDGEPYLVHGKFVRDESGRLIPDSGGAPFRLWRPALDPHVNPDRSAWPGIQNSDDIWNEIVEVTKIPGTTSAPKLQPIAARIVMLQSGMRAPMGVKVRGPDLATIERVGLQIEEMLKDVPSVEPGTVVADRMIGKPYLEIDISRDAIARYGLHIHEVQEVIEIAIGGKRLSMTVEGRERYPIRVRYQRELRDSIESLGRILVPAADGSQIPLTQLAEIRYVRGPQMIKSEDTFMVGYVVFDKKPDFAEVDVVETCQAYLKAQIDAGKFALPNGVSYVFAGNYENQLRASRKLMVVVPIALFAIFVILYLQFRSAITAGMIFTGVFVAWSGGFLMLWLYGQPWFLDVPVMGVNLRELFQVQSVNLSVAVWVGFLALFGIATDDGVVMATYLDQSFADGKTESSEAIRAAVLEAGNRRVRACLMTTATTLLALLPILTSTGRGSDIMIPMAIPTVGGMSVALLSMFVVPVLYCAVKEIGLSWRT